VDKSSFPELSLANLLRIWRFRQVFLSKYSNKNVFFFKKENVFMEGEKSFGLGEEVEIESVYRASQSPLKRKRGTHDDEPPAGGRIVSVNNKFLLDQQPNSSGRDPWQWKMRHDNHQGQENVGLEERDVIEEIDHEEEEEELSPKRSSSTTSLSTPRSFILSANF